MMRFSRLADYAVVVMTQLAADPGQFHNAVDTATATGLPAPTVSKIMATLARHGLLTSHRGAKGGYALPRPAGDISVAEIVSALDGPIAITHCVKVGPNSCEVEQACSSRFSLGRINTAVRRALENISLAEIAAPAAVIARINAHMAPPAPAPRSPA